MAKEVQKEVQTTPKGLNLNLSIVSLIKKGLRPSKMCEVLGKKKTTLQYYLSSLKRGGFIKKIGYGTWIVTKDYDEKEVQNIPRVAKHSLKNLNLLKPDSVRGHAFQFKIRLGEIRNWNRRTEIFDKLGIKYKRLMTGSTCTGQRIGYRGRKVWLTNKTIIIYEKSSYMGENAKESRSYAIYGLISLIKGLERLLRANFKVNGQYLFSVSRQHYALVKNALAKQYDREGKKLAVYNTNGLWFVIDNSFNLHEAETLHPRTAVNDNEKVQDFFNGVKEHEGFTPQFVVDSLAKNSIGIGQNVANLESYAVHLKAHVESVKQLGVGVEELTKIIKRMGKNNK